MRRGRKGIGQTMQESSRAYSAEFVAAMRAYQGTDGRDVFDGPGSRLHHVEHVTLPELEYRIGDIRGRRVLDYGCGTGSSTVPLIAAGADVDGFDIDAAAVGLAVERIREHGMAAGKLVAGTSAESAGLNAAEYDLVYMNCVLERVPHDLRHSVLADAVRCLRPGGVLAVAQSPNRWWPRDVYLTGLWFLPWTPPGSRVGTWYASRFGRLRGTLRPGPDTGRELQHRGVWGITYRSTMRALPAGSRCINMEPGQDRWSSHTRPLSTRRRWAESLGYRLVARPWSIPISSLCPMFDLLLIRLPDGLSREDGSLPPHG